MRTLVAAAALALAGAALAQTYPDHRIRMLVPVIKAAGLRID